MFWAGDSRVYVFEPRAAPASSRVDDLRDPGDALANLRQDSVVSNAMSADTDFAVNHRQVELTAPFLWSPPPTAASATCRPPMHFEHLVLAALPGRRRHRGLVAARCRQRIAAVTGDDAAMAVLGVGADHEEFRHAVRPADRRARAALGRPADELDAEVRPRGAGELAEARAARHATVTDAALWAAYKPGTSGTWDRGSDGDPQRRVSGPATWSTATGCWRTSASSAPG